MKSLSRLIVAAAAGLLVSACVAPVYRQHPGVVYAPYAPPAPRVAVMPPRPSVYHIWITGHWNWTGSNWHWRRGHWTRPPRPHAHWNRGHWRKHPRGWRWTPGHWR
jgi:hypothetical protein